MKVLNGRVVWQILHSPDGAQNARQNVYKQESWPWRALHLYQLRSFQTRRVFRSVGAHFFAAPSPIACECVASFTFLFICPMHIKTAHPTNARKRREKTPFTNSKMLSSECKHIDSVRRVAFLPLLQRMNLIRQTFSARAQALRICTICRPTFAIVAPEKKVIADGSTRENGNGVWVCVCVRAK